MLQTRGIHHITAMVADVQRTMDFYSRVLGLRLVKKTVNFDSPDVYHLYFGNESGEPGTVMTFFPSEHYMKGQIGRGQVGVITYIIPSDSQEFRHNRLSHLDITYTLTKRFGQDYLTFHDPDGIQIEMIARNQLSIGEWEHKGVPKNHAILGFDGVTLYPVLPHKTAEVLEHILGMSCVGQEGAYLRFQSSSGFANTIDIYLEPRVRGLTGAGTVHHIAWRASDEAEQIAWHEKLQKEGYYPTEILNRSYFKAIYFQHEGGILFEIATDEPGFIMDEPLHSLGEQLKLPVWLEDRREELENTLPELNPIERREQS